MDDNWRIAVGYICAALVLTFFIIGAAWIMSPQEFTFKFEIDNNTKDAIESVEYPIINEQSCKDFGIEILGTKNCTWNHTGRTG